MPHDFRKFQCLLLAACLTAGMTGRVEAGSVQFSTYYPAPFGVYDRLRLPPRAALGSPCEAGTFYYETGVGLRFCDEATLTWGSLGGGVWTQSGNNIYPADTTSNPSLKVGIGTTVPAQKLDVAGNINTSTGSAYMYNGNNVITASTALNNYFFGGAGNLTMTGSYNTANGYQALLSNTTGDQNTANGMNALLANTTGYQNTANGFKALLSNTTGYQNTANGAWALNKATGYRNTADGMNALLSNTSGSNNTANGWQTLSSNTSGSNNTADGFQALSSNTTGSYNTALGYAADVSTGDLTNATAIGYNAKVSASNSLVLGGAGGAAVNVGIGTTNPQQKLHIYNNGDNMLRIDTSNGAAYDPAKIAQIEFVRGPTWSQHWSWVGPTWDTAISAATWDIWTAENIPMLFAVNDDEKMRISTNGNVGIGTTNPGNYSINVEKTGDASLKLVADSDNNNNGDNPLIFMTQDGGGNAFLIGMVGTAGSDPLESLYTGTTSNAMFIGDPGGGGVTGDLQFGTNNAIRMTIDGSIGNVGIGTTAPAYQLQLGTDSAAKPSTNTWTIASDERIKTGINDFTDGLSTVLKLQPRTYKYNGSGGPGYDDADTHIGFVAQEAEPVAPYLVQTGAGVIGGAEVSDFKYYQGHALPFIIVNAIKEQQKQIEELKAENSALKNRIEILENK